MLINSSRVRTTVNPEEDISGLLDTIYQRYGYDFREYSEAHIRRRIANRMILSSIKTLAEVQERVASDNLFAAQLLSDLSITVTEMFRDPGFYCALRQTVIPLLKTYPHIKVWHAGCATGEEVYSLAIVLKEEQMYERATIYATDFNQQAIDHAKEGIYRSELIKEYTFNYQRAGGAESFSNYYTSQYSNVIMDQQLKKNIVWANHNLVTDGVFAEAHLILCRNVLIYFNRSLQDKVHSLFYNSLVHGGILCLGAKESLRFTEYAQLYAEMDKKHRIFKKKF